MERRWTYEFPCRRIHQEEEIPTYKILVPTQTWEEEPVDSTMAWILKLYIQTPSKVGGRSYTDHPQESSMTNQEHLNDTYITRMMMMIMMMRITRESWTVRTWTPYQWQNKHSVTLPIHSPIFPKITERDSSFPRSFNTFIPRRPRLKELLLHSSAGNT